MDHWQNYGILFTYLCLLLVAIFDEFCLISVVYFTFFFLCLFMHMRTDRPRLHIKRMLPFLVTFSGGTVLARYLYQFGGLSDLVQDIFPDNQCKCKW